MQQFADFHCDTLLKMYMQDLDFSKKNDFGHIDLPRLQQANYVFQCFAVFVDPKFGQEAALRQTLRLIDLAHKNVFSQPQVDLVTKACHLPPKSGNISGLLAIEGADFIGQDLFLLDLVYQMGVRLITLTWNWRNSIADGVKVGGTGGLTDFGKQVVEKMQQLNMIVDVSHLSEAGFWDVDKTATKPYVASHSNAWSVCSHPRNLKDNQIKAISRSKGLIGMNLCRPFVATDKKDQTLQTLVKHIVHISELVGTDVICLGFDLDGISKLPGDMKDVTDGREIVPLLEQAGFSAQEINAICCQNLLDFCRNNLE